MVGVPAPHWIGGQCKGIPPAVWTNSGNQYPHPIMGSNHSNKATLGFVFVLVTDADDDDEGVAAAAAAAAGVPCGVAAADSGKQQELPLLLLKTLT
mmetsp:Transcript_7570/g.8597  ORF Transcript_7570/g.8597 Transcript_7570/m.8597 type:complete len:96 (-) Transcript_7570:20-307(-)